MGENSTKDLYMWNGSSQESKGKRPQANQSRNEGFRRRSTSTLKDICLDEDFKGAELRVSKMFTTKKPAEKLLKDDIMIFADYQEKCRHFVKERREDSYSKMSSNVFELLAKSYGLTMSKLMDMYHQTSCNFSDLEECLKTSNNHILWTKEEDRFLLRGENLQLLKALKTERRVQERLDYLRG